MLTAHTGDRELLQLLVIEREIEFRLKGSEGSEWDDPVTDDTVFHAIVFERREKIVASRIVCSTEVGLEECTVLQYLMREVRNTELACIGEVLKGLFGLGGKLSDAEAEEDKAREESNVSGGHLLTSEDDAGVDARLLTFFVLLHVHAVTTDTVPKTFEELTFVRIYCVLKLVDVDQGIGALCDRVGERWNG